MRERFLILLGAASIGLALLASHQPMAQIRQRQRHWYEVILHGKGQG